MSPQEELLKVLNHAFNEECGTLFFLPQHLAQVDDEDTKRQLKKIAKMELSHAERVAGLIAEMSGTTTVRRPRMRPRALLSEMIDLHMRCEKKAIEIYRRAEREAADDKTREILSEIRRQEELHLRMLKKIAERVS